MENRRKFFLPLLSLALIAFSFASCTSIPNTNVVKHEETPTLTHESPAHEWTAKPVLIKFGLDPQIPAPFWVIRGVVPQFVLYANGSLFITKDGVTQQAQLTRQEMCALLNTVEQSGFFDVDLSAYHDSLKKILIGESDFSIIEVNAWRSRSEVLEIVLDYPGVATPSALRQVVTLLGNYLPSRLAPYQFTQIAIVIHKYPINSPYKFDKVWPASQPLEKLFEQGTIQDEQNSALILTGNLAAEIWGKAKDGGFTENGNQYAVSMRPLLPDEPLESALERFSGPVTSTVRLACSPTDGAINLK